MKAVTVQEIVEALRGPVGAVGNARRKELADRIEAHGIAYEPKGEEAIAPSDNVKQADEETHRRVDEAVRAGRIFDKRFRGGFVSVPAEPTQEMIDAGIMFGTSPTKVSIIWSNMLAAAPEVKP